jgi:hypothetical protein
MHKHWPPLTPFQRFESWLLDLAEKRLLPLLPRGPLRRRFLARLDRAHVSLHRSVHRLPER